MPTNQNPGDHKPPAGDFVDHPNSGPESREVGYETTDVNIGGVLVFIGGLFGFVAVFFFFCFVMGRLINTELGKEDGPKDRWHTDSGIFAGAKNTNGKRENLKSSSAIEQQELGAVTGAFMAPQLQTDDGNQNTADLHAREDLLLDHYSSTPGQPGIRIPIDRAMELIAAKGLPVTAAAQSPLMAGDSSHTVTPPLTSGFARTGYELDTIEARRQKLDYGKAERAEHAELKPIK
jgi:hypothetical protein